MPNRKSLAAAVFIPVVAGSIGFIHLTQLPRFAAIHTVDVLQLLGSGLCYGVALSAVLALLRGSRGA